MRDSPRVQLNEHQERESNDTGHKHGCQLESDSCVQIHVEHGVLFVAKPLRGSLGAGYR